jgi:hypothetical protein
MTKQIHIRTTERDYFYNDQDIREQKINLHFGADGRGIGWIKIIDSEFTNYQFWKEVGEDRKIEPKNPNWSIYIRIFETALESDFLGRGQTSKTRIMGEIKFYDKEGNIMKEDNFDWIAWHYSFHCEVIKND